jgi:hypothetical protein
MKTVKIVLIEAICIGIILSIMLSLFILILPDINLIWVAFAAFVCGAAFHVLCQVTGINDWYVKNYYK